MPAPLAFLLRSSASVPSTFTANNTIAITNSGQIGSSKAYTGGDGIFSLIDKTGFVYVRQSKSLSPRSPGLTTSTIRRIFIRHSDAQYAGTIIKDVANGGGFATSGLTNSGNLTSQIGNDLHAFAYGATAGGGSGTATVTISNIGTLTAKANGGVGILGYAHANTGYTGGGTTKSFTGGNSAATVSITNAGNITTGNATNNAGGRGIYGHAFAYAGGQNTTSAKGYSATGGNATAAVTVTNGNATVLPAITTNGGQSDINGNATANANGLGYVGHGGNASATTTLTNYGSLTMASGGATNNDMLQGVARAYASGYGFGGGNATASTGGSAKAVVTISNIGNLSSTVAPGIYGLTISHANANNPGSSPFTATAGTASSLTSIVNGNTTTSYGTAIQGDARTNAFAYANMGNGTAKGGTATATVSISNSGNLTTTGNTSHGGIIGNSTANANATGFNATGGTSSATTSISNSGTLNDRRNRDLWRRHGRCRGVRQYFNSGHRQERRDRHRRYSAGDREHQQFRRI